MLPDFGSMPIQDFLVLAVTVFGVVAILGVIGAVFLLVNASNQIARLEVPEGADFFETLQYIPITVPIALDLLDFAFDIFAAPISWFVLELLGLQALQAVTVIEGILPGTGILPTMTIAWFIARMMRHRQPQSQARAAVDRELQHRLEDRYRRRLSGSGRADEILSDYRSNKLLTSGSSEIVEGEFYDLQEEDFPSTFIEDEEF